MPKILVSIRLDERTVEALNEKANELGIGLSVLARNYIESMILHEKIGISRTIHLPMEEYELLLNYIVNDAILRKEYLELLKNEALSALLWIHGKNPEGKVPQQALKDLLEIFRVGGRINGYGMRDLGSKVVVKIITPSENLAIIFCELIGELFKDADCKKLGKTIIVLLRKEG